MATEAYVGIFTLLLTTVAASLASVSASILGYLKSRDAMMASRANSAKIDDIHVLLGSQSTEWKEDLIKNAEGMRDELIEKFGAAMASLTAKSEVAIRTASDKSLAAIESAFAKGVVHGTDVERARVLSEASRMGGVSDEDKIRRP